MKLNIIGTDSPIKAVPDQVIKYLVNITHQEDEILLGDITQTDYKMQRFLSDANYKNVTIYTSNSNSTLNLGSWPVRQERIPSAMRFKECDKILFLWDIRGCNDQRQAIDASRKPVTIFDMLLNRWC